MSIATDFQDLIDTLETNLQSMGVREAVYDPTTGIMALVNMITDIEPSTNIHLSLDLDLEANANSITYGENILLSATLLASYDDTSSSNVDLQTGEITGATITFKKGNTTIGTGITDENGVATLQYTPGINDCDTTLGFSAVFEGTSHFESANSTSVNVTVNSHLELTSNKNILSYADSDSAILTATLSSSQPTGRTINIYNDDTNILLGSMTDNNDGTYTYTYHSAGVGDLTLRAEVSGSLLTKTFSIEDLLRYLTNASQFASGFSSGTDGNYKYITGSSSNHSRLSPLNNPTFPNKFQIEFDYYKTTDRYGDIAFMGALNTKCFQISLYTGSPNNGKCGLYERITDSSESNLLYSTNGITLNAWHHVVFTYDNGNITFKVDNETVQTVTDTNVELSSYLYYRINNTSRIANLKVKPL